MIIVSAIKQWFGHRPTPAVKDGPLLDRADRELEGYEDLLMQLRAEVKAEAWGASRRGPRSGT